MAASGDVCGREWHGSSDMIILFVCVLALVDDPPSASRACECMPAWQDTLYATFYTFGFGLFLFALLERFGPAFAELYAIVCCTCRWTARRAANFVVLAIRRHSPANAVPERRGGLEKGVLYL